MASQIINNAGKCILAFASMLLFVVIGLFPISCSSDNSLNEGNDSKYFLKSSISADYYSDFIINLNQSLGTKSTFTAQDEIICKELCAPLLDDGLMIQQDLIRQANEQNAIEDVEFFQNLSDEQLATLSFIVYEIYAAIPNAEKTTEVTGEQLLTCLEAALGITAIKSLWNDIMFEGAVIGVTVKATMKAFGKHYLGWLGIAFTVYDFYDCISGWKNE